MNSQTKMLIKQKTMFRNLLPIPLLLTVSGTALASTTWYVNGVSGSDSNNCKSTTTACKTIGHAISLASSGDSIKVAAATYRENLTIGSSLNVIGSSASATNIDGGGGGTVVTISSVSAHVTLSGLTISNGARGIYNVGTLTLANSTVSGNRLDTTFTGTGGGGTYNGGTLTISNSTISWNSASCNGVRFLSGCGAFGGGIYNSNRATLTISNSTLVGNSAFAYAGACPLCVAYAEGGGIFNSGKTTMSNSTLSSNSTSAYGRCVNRACVGRGGGISNGSASMVFQNSILANNFVQSGVIHPVKTPSNCYGSVTSHGYNLDSDGSCNFHNSGDRSDIDPKLGPLQNNGGPTDTMALLPGSPAIDAGNPSGCTDGQGHLLKTDQRGLPRPNTEDHTMTNTGRCDMGAYELQSD